ncbi:MAG: hypothetical protein AB7S92_08710 [Parvibaculaceae bacterium]
MEYDTDKTWTVRGEARRGAHNARCFLAENPTLDALLITWHWTWDDGDQHEPGSPGAAYNRAYRDVLRPHMPAWTSLRGRYDLTR